jgi:hypothetical protein
MCESLDEGMLRPCPTTGANPATVVGLNLFGASLCHAVPQTMASISLTLGAIIRLLPLGQCGDKKCNLPVPGDPYSSHAHSSHVCVREANE